MISLDLKQQVSSSLNFAPLLIIVKHNSQKFSNLDKRITSKSQFWDIQVFWWKFAIFLMSLSNPQVSFSSNFASLFSVMTDNSSILFLGQTYFTQKEPIKFETLKILSAQVKIYQMPVTFETTNQFFFKCCIVLQCHQT